MGYFKEIATARQNRIIHEISTSYLAAAEWADDVLVDQTFYTDAIKTVIDFVIDFEAHIIEWDRFKLESVGHDLWLTRQRHGTGFWDREPEQYGSAELRDAFDAWARDLGECDDYEVIPGSDSDINSDNPTILGGILAAFK